MVSVIIALDIVFSNIPGPVPTSRAISSVEDSAKFQTIVGTSSYNYIGYTNHPSMTQQCLPGPNVKYVDSIHEYTTTTLMFAVAPNTTSAIAPYDILAQVDPTSGSIISIGIQFLCT
jgi:hypothetical protein